jgi:flagellar hook protein FlgE
MYTGVSGLGAQGQALGVVGDNIANVNTVGFKAQRGIFQDILGRSVGSSRTAGAGVEMASIQQLFTQGSLSTTGVATDLALSGDGFFMVKGQVAGATGQYFTREGQFRLDKDGFLVNASGLQVQGYAATAGGAMSSSLSSLQLPTSALPPLPTTEMSITANLDAGETVLTVPWDPQDPGATSNFSTSMTVYDSLGNSHSVDVYFRKTAANTWEYRALASGDEITGGTPGQNTQIGSGTLQFTTDGALGTVTTTTPISVNWIGATAGQAIELDFGSPLSGGGTGLDGLTQFGAPSSVSAQSQNGYSSGDLSGVSVDGQGVVLASYSNGEKVAVGQLAVARFRSNDGLARAGQNLWAASRDSGEAVLGTAGSGGRGAISAGAVEQSNVDLADQFVGLIAHQRAFQANSRTISTADEMLQELVNLKR